MESERNPSPNGRGDTGKKSIGVLNHDTAKTLYAGTDEIARCPECGRETLWRKRDNLSHKRECPYWEVNRQ